MIKKIARWILKEEREKQIEHIGKLNKQIVDKYFTVERLNEVCNKLKDEAFNKRGYIFEAERLTESEQFVIGKSIKHELIGLFKKMFKQYADINADLLMHGQKESEATRAKWELAVRIYDDLVMQLGMCEKIYNNKDRLKALERKNAIQKRQAKEISIRK